jgi:hypothetical protein
MDFEIFKSEVCHMVKDMGDIEFLLNILKSNDIEDYFKKDELLECFYLLGMVDYLCRVNNLPFTDKYNNIRQYKLEKPVFSRGIITICLVMEDEKYKEESLKEAIPEFLQFNIVEAEVRNVY